MTAAVDLSVKWDRERQDQETTDPQTMESLVSEAHLMLAMETTLSPREISRLVREYVREYERRAKRRSAPPTISYRDPTGEKAARNVDRQVGKK